MSSIILHPDVIRAKERIAELRRRLARLLDEHVMLNAELLPKLRDRYAVLFGDLERQLQERTLEMSQRKRMVELFALKLDRGQKLDAKMVELVMKAVGNEFAEIRQRVRRAVGQEDPAPRSSGPSRSRGAAGGSAPADGEGTPRQRMEEARRLYRSLAKKLHPDVRPEADELSGVYWDLVQKGYLRGDLQLLRTLENVVESAGGAGAAGRASATPEAEETRLTGAVAQEERRLAALKAGEPFTLKEQLEDEQWVAGRRAGMEKELAAVEEEIDKCNRFLDPILESARSASPPEVARDIWANWVDEMYFNHR